MDLDTIANLLYEDIQHYNKSVSYYTGKEIADTMAEEAHSAIKTFYSDYKPHWYVRRWNFWKSYRKIHTNRNGQRLAGVELLLNTFPDEYSGGITRYMPLAIDYSDLDSYSVNPKDVFWRVYGFGWHGIASIQSQCDVPITTPPPYTRLIKKRDEILKNQDKIIENAKQKAKKESYNLLY